MPERATRGSRESRIRTVGRTVEITIRDCEPIERVTGPNGDEWREQMYDLHSEADVLDHWAYNAVANHVTDVSRLDGWADVPPGTVTMEVR